jgi:hypothetical protein
MPAEFNIEFRSFTLEIILAATKSAQQPGAAHVRAQPHQQAGPIGPLRERACTFAKEPLVLKELSGTTNHYYHRLKLCTKHPEVCRLCNKMVPCVPTRGGATPAGTVHHHRLTE